MKHIDSTAMATLVKTLYDEVYMARQGAVSITPLVMPNAILIVGRPENVKTVKDLVARLDQPAVPGAHFQVFHLKHAAASAAQTTIQNAFTDRGGLSPTVRVTADPRTNSLIVQASPRDMAEVADLIRQIDVTEPSTQWADQRSANHTAGTHARHGHRPDHEASHRGDRRRGPGANQGGQFGQGGQPGGPGGPARAAGRATVRPRRATAADKADARGAGQPAERHAPLSHGRRQRPQAAEFGNPHRRHHHRRRPANALVISSPPENLDLLEGLVRQLDNLPAAEAQIKVFTIVNGDATEPFRHAQDALYGAARRSATPARRP